ncbi:MAG TPA: hypothetical protein VGA00_00925 [Acidiferrobacterales bacterium]
MSWLPTIVFALALTGLLLYGFIKAPHWLHTEVETERDAARLELSRADAIEGVLVELGKMRRRGVSMRNDLAIKDALNEADKSALLAWHSDVMGKLREITPAQAEIFDALDIINITLPDYIARHPELVHHSERLARLKDVIDRYDAMVMAARGLGKREL